MATKNETLLTPSQRPSALHLSTWVTLLTNFLASLSLFRKLAGIYSTLFEENVSAHQAVYFFYAQLSGVLFLLPTGLGSGWRMWFFVLFCVSAKAAMGKCFHKD